MFSILTRPLHTQRAVGTEGVDQASCDRERRTVQAEQPGFSVGGQFKLKQNESLKHSVIYG